VNVLSISVTKLALPGLVEQVLAVTRSNVSTTVLYVNVHVLNTAYRDPELRRILNQADLVYCDGAGVKLGARLLGYHLPERMTGADWIELLCTACAERGTMLYFLGSQPGVAARAAELLQARYPRLRVAGTHHGYLADPAVSSAAIAAVNGARPHILLVGMGTPTQERWISSHRRQLEVPVVWAVGALFDFVASVQPRGPRWMLDHGLEWLCRLWADPPRLWKRYIVGNPLFIWRVLMQRLGFDL
jgi:N-acetylglucosaminyldiphosphoundecaprenol N-acetyl-beta-D-mannosaminyltransferase